MKRMLMLLLAMVVIITPCFAEDIDLSTMTGEQLMALRDRIDSELNENHYVGYSDESAIERDLENYFADTYQAKSYEVRVKVNITNDWGLFKATGTYKVKDITGDVYAEYRQVDYDLTKIFMTVDELVVLDEREADQAAESEAANEKEQITKVQFGTLLDVTVNEIDNIIVIKTKITPAFNNKQTIDQNYFNIDFLISNYGVDEYKELQYWAVADMTDGSEGKVISFTVSQKVMQQLKGGLIPVNKLGDYVTDLWILPSLTK